ncbi:lytic murein transglycosylase [Moraxella oculi]|uniref:Lytic murein transglycosylase n=1 Tax=Moraxella oculi TaxID=2940516 RepID=A0ABW8U370_9GAMM
MKKNTNLLFALVCCAVSTPVLASELPKLSTNEFHQCLTTLKNSATFKGISETTFETYRPSEPDPSVIRSLNHQPEFKKDVWDYHASLVDVERVIDGLQAKAEQADVLQKIQARYGVQPEHVLGVWGVESNFGQTLGGKNLFRSLATLSCFDRRQNYFRKEFANALRIVQNGDIQPKDMIGSWAGAFGQTQFMPSTFLELAVDFDNDGHKDLVNSKADALASTANFLSKRGYRTGEPWGYEVRLNGYTGPSGRTNKHTITHWQNQGITLPDGRPIPNNMASAGLLLPAGFDGPAFLVGRNFDTFYRYNNSESYALAIAHLSTLIENASTNTQFTTAWPTDDAGISRREAKEIQQALANAGYDIGQIDGIIGDNTRRAIMDYQRKVGVTPNGRAGQKFYRLITQTSSTPATLPTHNSRPYQMPISHVPTSQQIATPIKSVVPKTYQKVINADGTISLIPKE